jgi:hypothetical protein
MLFTRFWFLVLAALAGFSIAAMSLARGTYEHDRASDAASMLASDRRLLDEFLRRDARSRIDDLAPVSSNSQLVTALAGTLRRTEDTPAAIGTTITQKLRELNQGLGPLRGEILLAVDTRGVVVGRTGIGEGEVGTNLGGLPVVASAIAGNVRDDLWDLSGQAYRIAARPVISEGRYYVGAIVHAMAINDAFVATIGQLVPGASLMFYGPDGMYASAHPPPEHGMRRAPAPATLVERLREVRNREDLKTRGVTDSIPMANNEGVSVYATLPGMVGAAGGGVAVARPVPTMPTDFLLKASKDDLSRVPGFAIGLVAFLLAIIGNILVYIEHDSKSKKLTQGFKNLVQDGMHLDPLLLGGFARDIAVVANEGIDEVVKREVQRSAGRGLRNVNELESLLKAPETPKPAPAVYSPPVHMPPPHTPPMPSPAPAPPAPPAPMVPGANIPAPPNVARAAPPPPPNVRRAQPPQVDEDEHPTNVVSAQHVAMKPDVPAPPLNNNGAVASDPEEAQHWREIYEQFLATKRECGEPIDALTFEKFSGTLTKHREQLVSKTACRTVRFQVYVKDSKATLKATPVR